MKIDKRFKIEVLDGRSVIIDDENGNVLGVVDFNEIKLFLWEKTSERDLDKNQMLTEILNRFDISTVLALGEIDYFIKKIKEYGIV